jgi:thioredoxin-dependent peroxiredoxin
MEPGSLAPSFTLPDQDGKPVSSASLAGRWVVLYFYPRDDTPGCTVEACEFTAARSAFTGLDAVVYGCSADSATAHQKFITKHELGIGLLTDADRAVMKAYGAWGKKVMYGKEVEGVIRSTVLIAPDGRIAHHWKSVKAAGHAEQVRAKLAELQGGGAPAVKAKAAKAKVAKSAKPKAKAAKPKPKPQPKAKPKPKPKPKAKRKG